VILATELSGTTVLNSNHDFYWEGGKPLSKREEDAAPGVRDHFFTNYENREFFTVFKKLYPWNGKHWLQLTINRRQSRRLIKKFGFSRKRVRELNTAVSDAFFAECSTQDKMRKRLAMAYILSDGSPLITPVPVSRFLKQTGEWMKRQKPVLCGAEPGITLNIAGCSTWYLLQPTRVIPRKRIHHNLRLIGRLLALPEILREFEQNGHRQLVLHISGPVPMEHERYLRRVVKAYQAVIREVPGHMTKRVFLAFSVGGESHPVFSEYGLHSMHIRDIYQLADIILFPSETEGRGLPLIESGATGVPIVSRRYKPHRVFDEVVGAHLPEKLRIYYIRYPAHTITDECVREVADALLDPASTEKMIAHNRSAVAERYSMATLENTFRDLLNNI
jgi:glycosyltransferase involved in cell wall biosynthesis